MRTGRELIRALCEKVAPELSAEFELIFAQLDVTRGWTEAASSNPRVGAIDVGSGSVVINDTVNISQGGEISFSDAENNPTMSVKSQSTGLGGGHELQIKNMANPNTDGTRIKLNLNGIGSVSAATLDYTAMLLSSLLTSGAPHVDVYGFEDSPDRFGVYFEVRGSSGGADRIRLTSEGPDGGEATNIRVTETASTPSDPTSGVEVKFYLTDDGKFVFQYNDAGIVRYKYLDLTGTGVTWVHTTTAP